MTTNQVAYQTLLESKRHNQANEFLTNKGFSNQLTIAAMNNKTSRDNANKQAAANVGSAIISAVASLGKLL